MVTDFPPPSDDAERARLAEVLHARTMPLWMIRAEPEPTAPLLTHVWRLLARSRS
jgi:hypothetical protein